MDFANLEGISVEVDNLNPQNPHLRCSLYVEFANTRLLQNLYSDVIMKFKKFVDESFLLPAFDQDILYSFFQPVGVVSDFQEHPDLEVNLQVNSYPLFPTINVASTLRFSHQTTTKMNKIGYQHLYVLSSPGETSDSSPNQSSDSDNDEAGDTISSLRSVKKRKIKSHRKSCEDDTVLMLQYHFENMSKVDDSTVHVDLLIFMDKIYCKILSKYLGLIYVEELLEESEDRDLNQVLYQLSNNKSAKLFRMVQKFINKKLIRGFNNVCLTHSLPLWKNFNANARAVVSNENNKLLYVEAFEATNFSVDLGKDPTVLDYVEAISVITDNALKHKTHIIARYLCGKESYQNVKLPLIAVVPLYVLRYFTQCEIVENVLQIN